VRRTAREPSRWNDTLSLEQAAIAGLGVCLGYVCRDGVKSAHGDECYLIE
jgi:hypothetical protein